jgi:hypothetical protein
MAPEKRRHPRAEISWPVTIISPDGLVSCRTKNLSLVGTLISCSKFLELPHSFYLVFNPSGHKVLLAGAEKVWFETCILDSSGPQTMGVRFTFIPNHDYFLISKAISGHKLN